VRKKSLKSRSPAAPDLRAGMPPHEGVEGEVLGQICGVLLNDLDVGVATVSSDATIRFANRRFGEMLARPGYEQLAGSNLKRFISAQNWGALETAIRQATRKSTEGEVGLTAVPGGSRTIRLSFAPIEGFPGACVRIVATDVTQLVEAAKALETSEASLHSLSARLLQLQDEERRKMARELHDTTGQELAIAIISLENLAHNLGKPSFDTREVLRESVGWLRKVEGEIRTLSYVLHPPLLDEKGLGSALSFYVEGFAKRTGIQVETDIPESIPRLSSEKETALFRIVQESLTNILRHAHCDRAWIRVSVRADEIRVSIEDRGNGFDSHKVSSSRLGVGIPGMRGRLQLMGGTLQVHSGPHRQGTQVIASVPLGEEETLPAPAEEQLPFALARAGRRDPSREFHARKRILIVDDHEIARRGIRDLFREEHDLEICGEASDGVEALSKVHELKPDLVILDLSMPNLGGFGVANRLRHWEVPVKILIYTTHCHSEIEQMARSTGCDGYVQKANAAKDLVRATRAILQGKRFYTSEPLAKTQSA
jgi:signal transduction histidine kinase/ActR/RegA family two-component response regulator